jgi:outer membrane protein assembly factor BamB
MQPSSSQNVYAVGTDGTHRWRYAASKGVPAVVPTADGVYAIVGWTSRVTGVSQQLIRLADAELQWKTDPRNKYLSILGTVDGAALVSTNDDEVSREGESLFAVTSDNRTRFQRETGDIRSAVVQDGTLYAVGGLSRTSAFSTGDGTRLWTYPGRLLGDTSGNLGDTLYLEEQTESGDNALAAVDAATGESRWQYLAEEATEDGFMATGAIEHDGMVYATDYGGLLVALQSTDGTELWRYQTPADMRDPPTVANDTVYVPVGEAALHAADRTAGERRWTHSFERSLREVHTTRDGLVCRTQGDDAAGMCALSFDGEPLWDITIQGTTTAPTVTDLGTYIGTDTGYLVKLGA